MPRGWRIAAVVVAVAVGSGALLAAPAPAGEEGAAAAGEGTEKDEAPKRWCEGETLTGEWFGIGERLEDRGLAISAFYLNDFTRIQKGGKDRHDDSDRYWLEVRADFDLHRVGLPEGARLSAAYWQLGGENGSKDVPAFQTVSVYESDPRVELAELFYEQEFGEVWRIKVGKMDATYDFTYTDYGNDFLNLGESYPPNLLGIPSIPDPAVGGAFFYEPETGPYAGVGIFDGALQDGVPTGRRGVSTLFGPPPDMFGVVEAGFACDCGGLPKRLGLGVWHHTGDFPEYKGGNTDGTTGYYGILEGRVWRKSDAKDDERGLYGILRATLAEERINPVERHYVAAAVWKGPIPSRGDDALGAAWMVADLTDDRLAGMRSATEQVLEVYYKVQITPFLSVMPDVQYVANGGGGVGDALVLGARIVIQF